MESESESAQDKESKPLLCENNDYSNDNAPLTTTDKVWPYLVLLSSLLSFALGAGFNLGIAGALTVAQSQRFDISLDQSSWSTSVHTIFFLMTSMYMHE